MHTLAHLYIHAYANTHTHTHWRTRTATGGGDHEETARFEGFGIRKSPEGVLNRFRGDRL